MATLEKLRKRSGLLLAIVIGMALLAFVLSDLFKKGNPIVSGTDTDIAEVAGKSIPFQFYQQRVEEFMEATKRNTGQGNLDEQTMEMVKEQAWESLIRDFVMEDEFGELGVAVCMDELFDMVQGNNIDQRIRQIPIFQNQQTKQFDRSYVVQFIKNLDQDPTGEARESWLSFEEELMQSRRTTKYNNLISKGIYIPKDEATAEAIEKKHTYDFSYIVLKYSEVSDSAVEIREADVKQYYEDNLKDFEQEASRDIEYITFDVEPSDKDYNQAKEWIHNIYNEFTEAEDDIQFVNLNADTRYENKYYKKGELSPMIDSLMFVTDIDSIIGPYFEEETYKLTKLLDRGERPDSINARHILISYTGALRASEQVTRSKEEAEKMADSLFNALKANPQNFDQTARTLSDGQTRDKGGNLEWFLDGSMVPEFNDVCLEADIHELRFIETDFGFHIIEVLDRTEFIEKVKIATVDRKVIPSGKTYQGIYSRASKFAGINNTREKFDMAVNEQQMTKKVANNLTENSKTISGLESPREVVRWAFSAEKDELSPIFELGDRFVIAVVTEIREKGPAPLEQVREEIEMNVKKDMKAEQLTDKINKSLKPGTTLENVAQDLGIQVMDANSISFNAFSIPGAGVEPNVIGTLPCIEKGSLSKPVKGTNGVYVVMIKNIEAPEEIDYQTERTFLLRNLEYRANMEAYEALKESANIEDNRAKFF